MPTYHFALRNDASTNEDLGFVTLADDEEALEFGRETVSLILRDHAPQHSGPTIEITENRRAVGGVSFESVGRQKQKQYE